MKLTVSTLTLCLFTTAVFAMPGRVASISKYQGKVGLRHDDGRKELVRRTRTPLFQSDTIFTAHESTASILYADGTRLDLSSKSKVKIEFDGRQRQIALQQGSIKSDVKKIPGQRTTFNTPAGVAAVKGTLVNCVLLAKDEIRISADLGLLTHQIPSMRFAMDLSQDRCAKVKFDKSENQADVLSVRGDLIIEVADVVAKVEEGKGVSLRYDAHSGIVSLNEVIKNAQANKPDVAFIMDTGDGMDFLATGTGYTATITAGDVAVRNAHGAQTVLKKGDTLFSSRKWLEPETPEGVELQLSDLHQLGR